MIAEGTDEYNAQLEVAREWFHSQTPVETFRNMCRVMLIKKEFISQMENNPEIMKIMWKSLEDAEKPRDYPIISIDENGEAPSEEVAKWASKQRHCLWKAVLDNCENRYDASAAQLSSCLRISITELNQKLFETQPELLKSYQKYETEWRTMNWFQQTCEVVGITEDRFKMMKTNTKLVEMIVKCAREIALNHGFSEVVNDKWKHDPKLEANGFREDLFRAVFRLVFETIDLRQDLRTEFAEHWFESMEEYAITEKDPEKKANLKFNGESFKKALDRLDPFVIDNGVRMRTSRMKKNFQAVKYEGPDVSDADPKVMEETRRQLEYFRIFGGLIHWKKEDIDEMEKNLEIVELVMNSIANQSFSFDSKEPISDVRFDPAWRTIYESCLHRSGPAVEELRGRMRRSAADYFKEQNGNNPNFEKLRQKKENEWKTSVWFKESCSRLLITKERYQMMKTNPKIVKMIGECAREIALRHGFAEVINNEEKRDPKLTDEEYRKDLFKTMLSQIMTAVDQLDTEFAEHLLESRKVWIEKRNVSEEEKKSLMEYLVYLQNEIDEKDPFVVHNGLKMRSSKLDHEKFKVVKDENGEWKVVDKKDLVMRNKDPKSLEEGSEEEIGEESDEDSEEEPSFLGSMLGRLGL
uniref:RING-type domain-containing protein n=1 Tax=Caenorhabditis tropicalis TaxID=1561998 RepID=A0A1I7TUC8_9PELO